MSKKTLTQINIPRRIFFFGLLLVVMGFIAGANEQPILAISLIIAGCIAGFTAFGLKASDDG